MGKIKILIISAVVIIAGVSGFFGYQKYQSNEKVKSAQNTRQAVALQPTPPPTPPNTPFQPEGQMLIQAINANEAASKSPESQPVTNTAPEHPINAASNLKAYSYDASVCQSSSAAYLCFAQFYKDLTNNYGASIAISDMKQRFNTNAVIQSDCHPLMHVVGRTAASAYTTVAEAFQHGDVFCWSGYYHGILEGMVAKIGLKNLPAEMNNVCADIPGKATYNFDYYNCVHGLGHGVMALLGDDVFASLKMCDNLTGSWEDQSCYSGVFMQNIIDSTNVADTDNVVKDLKPGDPLYPCDAVDQPYKYQCYLGQTSYALQVDNYDFGKVFALCAGVEQPFRDTCNQSMGRDAANQARHIASATTATCALANNANDTTNCMIGAVKEIISYYHDITQANAYCDIQQGGDKDTCHQTATAYYKNF